MAGEGEEGGHQDVHGVVLVLPEQAARLPPLRRPPKPRRYFRRRGFCVSGGRTARRVLDGPELRSQVLGVDEGRRTTHPNAGSRGIARARYARRAAASVASAGLAPAAAE